MNVIAEAIHTPCQIQTVFLDFIQIVLPYVMDRKMGDNNSSSVSYKTGPQISPYKLPLTNNGSLTFYRTVRMTNIQTVLITI